MNIRMQLVRYAEGFKKFEILILPLLLLAAIDYFFIRNFSNQLANSGDLITPLITFNSIILASLGIMYQVRSTQDREIKFRIQEQRREFYIQFLEYLAKFFSAIKEKGSEVKPTDIISSNKEYFFLHYKMAVLASPDVINTYSEIMREGALHSDDPMWAMSRLAKIFMFIRKEVGFSEGDIAVRRILSLWINDINDPKYNELFKNLR